jgi:CRISPR-associated endonuclease Cas3-HD
MIKQHWFPFLTNITLIQQLIDEDNSDIKTDNNLALKQLSLNLTDGKLYELFICISNNIQDSYLHTLTYIFNDLKEAKFENDSSVNFKYDAHIKQHYTNYDLLSSVDLLTHTINVVNEAINLTFNVPSGIKNIVLLLALVHDFGKSSYIQNMIGEPSDTKHEVVSAKYIQLILTKNIEQDNISLDHISSIYKILSNHHSHLSRVNNQITELFYKADHNARKNELKFIKKEQKAKL